MLTRVQHGVWEYEGRVNGSFPCDVQIKKQGKPYEPTFNERLEVDEILLGAYNGRSFKGMAITREVK